MNVCFVSPKRQAYCKNRLLRKFFLDLERERGLSKFYPSLGPALPILARLLPKGSEAKIVDEDVDEIDYGGRFDLVAISLSTQQAMRAYSIADRFRKKGTLVVLGGLHPSVMCDEAKEHADVVVVGEAETTWPMFINDYLSGKVRRVYKEAQPGCYDLRRSPLPRYDLIKHSPYTQSWVQCSRGCPIDCEFCASSKIYGLRHRHKSIEQVVREIKFIKREIKGMAGRISFADDNLCANKTYAKQLMRAIAPFNISFFAETDISIAKHPELLKLLKAAGCEAVLIGFESVNPKSLEHTDPRRWKYRHLGNYPDYIKTIQGHGIEVLGSFVFGFDHDDVNTISDTREFILENELRSIQVAILTPFPGTRLFRRLHNEGRIITYDWSYYTGLDLTFVPARLKERDIVEGIMDIYKNVFDI